MAFAISFVVYTLAVVGIGLYAARRAGSSDEDYFLAGRSLGPWVASMSASASSMSGWVTLGLVGLAFDQGYSAYWLLPGCTLGYAFNWFVLAGPLRDRAAQLDALTLPDFFAFHFRERWPILRVASVIVIFIAMLMYVAAQFAAAGKAFEASFEGFEYHIGVLVGAAVVIIYTVLGGFRAACWTDFVQAIMMVGALLLLPIYLLINLGGFGYVHEQFATVSGDLLRFTPARSGFALIGFLLGSGALGINFGYPGQPHVLVRFMGMRSRGDVRFAGSIATVWSILLLWGAVTTGIVVRAMTIDGAQWAQPITGDPEIALVLAARHLLHGVLGGMVLAAILAAIASTADSQLVVAASAAANDIYARLFDRHKSASHPWINRIVVLTLGVAAALIVMVDEVGVYNYVVSYGWAMLGAAFGPQLILILLWRRASYAGCVAGLIAGFVMTIAWPQVYQPAADDPQWYNLTVAFIAAMALNVFITLLRPDRQPLDVAG